jgi:hypothetical protein
MINGSDLSRGKRLSLLLKCSDQLLGLPSFLFKKLTRALSPGVEHLIPALVKTGQI